MRTLATTDCSRVEDDQPRLQITHSPAGARVLVCGRWTADALSQRAAWAQLQAQLQTQLPTQLHASAQPAQPAQRAQPPQRPPQPAAAPDMQWDIRSAQRIDHTGAQLLWNTWGRQWPAQLEVLPQQRVLLERVAQFSVAAPQADGWQWQSFLVGLGNRLGQGLRSAARQCVSGVQLLGQLVIDGLYLLRHPRRAPWRDVSAHLYRIGATALPVTALVGFLIGVVLAYLLSRQLHQFGADSFIVNILGLALIREMGPVLAAILVAGRSGSAITAQIGVMRVNEELDAMRVMGIAPGLRLVWPRTMALALAMPLVAVWTTLAALLGGMLAALLGLGLTPAYFVAALPQTVEIANLWLALGKSVVFGVLIALIACHFGLRVRPNAQSLGECTTASVVSAITAVLLADALCAVLFKKVGL